MRKKIDHIEMFGRSFLFSTLLLFITILSAFAISATAEEMPVGKETTDITIKSAYNDTSIHFLFEFNSADMQYPGIYHDYSIYENGEWVLFNEYNEDRITMLVGGHQVNHFDTLGCFVACHADMRYMPDSPSSAEVRDHPYFNDTLRTSNVQKYISQSRNEPVSWDNVKTQSEFLELRENGTFLDFFHWRAHRSNPIGYSDSQNVLSYRHNDPGNGPFYNNWNATSQSPLYMFNTTITGFEALEWEDLRDRKLGMSDYYYMAEDFIVPFDPDHDWQDGDTIPRLILREPTESRGQITANGTWSDGTWTVELTRKLDTGYHLEDVVFQEGGVYYISPAVHVGDTSGRDHYVTWGHSLGIGNETAADIVAVRFGGHYPQWHTIQETAIELFYPSVMSYDFLLDANSHTASGVECTLAGNIRPPHSALRMGQFAFALERSLTAVPPAAPERGTRRGSGFGAENVKVQSLIDAPQNEKQADSEKNDTDTQPTEQHMAPVEVNDRPEAKTDTETAKTRKLPGFGAAFTVVGLTLMVYFTRRL